MEGLSYKLPAEQICPEPMDAFLAIFLLLWGTWIAVFFCFCFLKGGSTRRVILASSSHCEFHFGVYKISTYVSTIILKQIDWQWQQTFNFISSKILISMFPIPHIFGYAGRITVNDSESKICEQCWKSQRVAFTFV